MVSQQALDSLRAGFHGKVLSPRDPGYDAARTLFNAMIDRRPALIAQCATVDDVRRALRFARGHDLPVSVRGGGHGVAGKAVVDDGLMIDLRLMHEVRVDPDARTATIAGGATMSHLDRATAAYGLATTGGRVSTTGVGGYALGGGDGWMARKMGLACDNLLAVELVTADGEVIQASEREHPDLFWALHGGGGNFGVATKLTFRLHELDRVTVALLFWPPEAAPEVLRAYRDVMEKASDDFGGGSLYLTAPEESFVPDTLVNRLAFAILIVYAGTEDAARAEAAPLFALRPQGRFLAEMAYADLQCMLDDPPGYRNYWSAEYLDALPDAAIDRYCARAADMIVPSPSQQALFPQGGAIARGSADYPIPWRNAPWCLHPFGLWAAAGTARCAPT